jgi:DNA polymerase-1
VVALVDFASIWLVDFEFAQPEGARPRPICLVAHEWRGAQTVRLWLDGRTTPPCPPYACDRHALFVAFFASAELSCHRVLRWPPPAYVLDLFTEFRWLTNGRSLPCGNSLLGALTAFGLDGIAALEKDAMRTLAMRGGPWSGEEQRALLNYCESDVMALRSLLPAMLPHLDFPRALLRGRYMRAVAHMEYAGIPIDVAVLSTLRTQWSWLQDALIQRIDQQYHVFDGRSFREERWVQWLARQGIGWPRLPSGRLCLDKNTFRDMSLAHPAVSPMKELRATLSQLRLEQLPVGPDNRNRTLLSPFRAKTGRNAPSNSKSIFGPAVWLRHLITPEPGCGVVYLDWSQQEFGIAGVLSRDPAMIEAYSCGDPYLRFAVQAGAVPASATKTTHGAVREQFKACVLAVQYGMGAESLASRIGQSPAHARALLRAHRATYPRFWQWSDSAVDYAVLSGRLYTVFGWQLHVVGEANFRSLRNFLMQANGSEMLRVACCLATEAGIEVCAPVHDALLIHAPLAILEEAVSVTRRCMEQASAAVLHGFVLRTEAHVFCYPEHYADVRGQAMWHTIRELLAEQEPRGANRPVPIYA